MSNFKHSSQDKIAVIAAVELDGKTPEEAASARIAENEGIWKSRVP